MMRINFKFLMLVFLLGVGAASPLFADESGRAVYKALDSYERGVEIQLDSEDAVRIIAREQAVDKQARVPSINKAENSLQSEILTREIRNVNAPESFEDLPADKKIDSLDIKDMNIVDVLKLIADKSNLNIIAGKGVVGKITIYLKDVYLKDALRIILDSNNLAYKVEGDIVRIMMAKEYEDRYGYAFGGRVQTRIIPLQYADPADVTALLNQVKTPSGKIISDIKSGTLVLVDAPEQLDILQDLIKEIDVKVETRIFELSYASVKEVSDKVLEALTKDIGQVNFDERSGKIIVTDTYQKLDEIQSIIEAFDVKQTQVLIEAKIIQIVLSDQHKFGIDWEAIVQDHHGLDLTSNFDILSSGEKRGSLSIGTIASDDYTVLVQALESVGTTNILSNPSISTLNNQEAKILVGSTEPYVTTTTTTPASGPSTTAESVNFIDVGVKLFVTPTIHKDDFITMKIKPEVSSVTRTLTTSNNNTIPIVETSEAETTVMVKDNVTIVIGGLIKEEKIESINKIPLLGDIPFIGNAFRNVDDFVRKTEIVIFLTPKLISGDIPDEVRLETVIPSRKF